MFKKYPHVRKKYNSIAILLFFLISLQLSGETDKKLLILGDSLSAGYGIPLEKQWAKVVQRKLNSSEKKIRLINSSLSGETSGGGLSRISNLLIIHSPDFILIELGGNDALRGYPVEKIKSNLKEICKIAQKHKVTVILMQMRIPPNYGKRYSEALESIYTELAGELNIKLVPFMLNNIALDSSLMLPDGIHPIENGQLLIAEEVFKWMSFL